MNPTSNKRDFEDLTTNLKDLAYSYLEKYSPSKQQLKIYLLKKYLTKIKGTKSKKEVSAIIDEIVKNLEISKQYSFLIGQEKVTGRLKRLAPMSISGSNSRLAIFEFNKFFVPGSLIDLILKISRNEKGFWLPINSLSQSEQGLWSVYSISGDEKSTVERDLVQVLHFENNYAYVSGTLKDGDLVVKGGLSKIIEGQTLK